MDYNNSILFYSCFFIGRYSNPDHNCHIDVYCFVPLQRRKLMCCHPSVAMNVLYLRDTEISIFIKFLFCSQGIVGAILLIPFNHRCDFIFILLDLDLPVKFYVIFANEVHPLISVFFFGLKCGSYKSLCLCQCCVGVSM